MNLSPLVLPAVGLPAHERSQMQRKMDSKYIHRTFASTASERQLSESSRDFILGVFND